jgi:sn-glycerol 3-phosphate transport system substrate-binding protein
MQRRTLLAGTASLVAAPFVHARAAETTRIVWWHAMTASLADEVNRLAALFNKSQSAVEVQPVYKGGYGDTLTATIAASRAGQAPHLVQIFEVGTGTMLAAGKAVKQIWELAQETGVALDPAAYIPGVRGYYSLPDGRMASMPFNSSTAVLWYSKDAFRKAGLDPEAPPATWPDLVKAAETIKAKNAAEVAMTTSWPTWIQLEEFSALHDLPFASQQNGFGGLDTQLEIASRQHVTQVQRLLDMAKAGTFTYAGRDNAPDPLLLSGQAGIAFNSSGIRGALAKSAKFDWGVGYLPYDPALIKTPLNSIIGGASLWAMTAPSRSTEEYRAVAQFLAFLGRPENDAAWHQATGYVPVTLAGFELSQQQGFYSRNPGADLPVKQLARGQVTSNSKGLRLGRLLEIRNIIQEELEKALQGGQSAQQAMEAAVSRGDRVLREFQKSVKA